MNYILTEEVLRLQKLAGITPPPQEPILEDLLLEAYIEVYCLENNLLRENLNEGFVDILKKEAKKLNLQPTVAYVSSLLAGLKKMFTDEGYEKILNIIKDYKGSKNIPEITDYVIQALDPFSQVNEGIFDYFRNKKTGQANLLSKSIISTLVLSILLHLAASSGFAKAESSVDKVPAATEISVQNAIDSGASPATGDAIKTTDNTVDQALQDTNIEGGEDSNVPNPISTDNAGVIKVKFNTGDFEISDEDQKAKEISDEIIKQAKGKKIKSTKINIKGLISNTPGAGDDDPNGPGKEGLGQKRLEAGKKLTDKIIDNLEKENPEIKVTIEDGGTNVNNPGAEVEVDSKEAKDNQAVSFELVDMETEEDTKTTDSSDFQPLTFFRTNKPLTPDTNKYYVILGSILPAITDDKQPSEEFMKILNIKEGDVINDAFVNKKIGELKKSNTKEAKQAIQILAWAQKVKKNPKSIGEFLNSLDEKMPKLTWEKRVLTKPGERGKAAFAGGSGATQTPAPSAQAQDRVQGAGATPKPNMSEIKLHDIYNNLILEAQVSEWESLPDYNKSLAKNNLGILVPLYVYTWEIADNGALQYVSGIGNDGTINKNNPYQASWRKFEEKYPIIWSKANKDIEYITSKDKTKPSAPVSKTTKPSAPVSKTTTSSVDPQKEKIKNTQETNKIIKAINSNSSLKSALNNINTVDEFKELVLAFMTDLPYYKDKKPSLKTALNKIKSRIQPRDEKGKFTKTAGTTPSQKTTASSPSFSNVSTTAGNNVKVNYTIKEVIREIIREELLLLEASTLPDVVKSEKIIDTYNTLKLILPQINTEEEIIQLIVRTIIPYLNPSLKGNANSLKQAIMKAQSELEKTEPNDINLKEIFIKVLKENIKIKNI